MDTIEGFQAVEQQHFPLNVVWEWIEPARIESGRQAEGYGSSSGERRVNSVNSGNGDEEKETELWDYIYIEGRILPYLCIKFNDVRREELGLDQTQICRLSEWMNYSYRKDQKTKTGDEGKNWQVCLNTLGVKFLLDIYVIGIIWVNIRI